MSPTSDSTLREMVRAAIRDELAGRGHARDAHDAAAPAGVAAADAGRRRVETVSLRTDADLDRFVRDLVTLVENPKTRMDIRSGRLRFRLQPGSAGERRTSSAARRIERGAVTERQVEAAARAGERLVLGRGAVLTPLARERSRALSVQIDREH